MYTGDNLLKYDLVSFHDTPLDTWLHFKKKKEQGSHCSIAGLLVEINTNSIC